MLNCKEVKVNFKNKVTIYYLMTIKTALSLKNIQILYK